MRCPILVRWLTHAAAFLLLAEPAFASVSVVNFSATTSVLPGAPANGNIVVGGRFAESGTGQTFKDSNNVSLANEIGDTDGTIRCNIWDYTVSGSPTATYTTGGIGSKAILQISGGKLSLATYFAAGGTGSVTYTSHVGDVVVMTITNGSDTPSLTNVSGSTSWAAGFFGTATSTSGVASSNVVTDGVCVAVYTPVPGASRFFQFFPM